MTARTIDLAMALVRATERAVLVADAGSDFTATDPRLLWLPLSQVAVAQTGERCEIVDRDDVVRDCAVVTVTLPEWLATKRGLI